MLDEGGRLYGWRGWSGGAFQRQSGFGLPQQSIPVFFFFRSARIFCIHPCFLVTWQTFRPADLPVLRVCCLFNLVKGAVSTYPG